MRNRSPNPNTKWLARTSIVLSPESASGWQRSHPPAAESLQTLAMPNAQCTVPSPIALKLADEQLAGGSSTAESWRNTRHWRDVVLPLLALQWHNFGTAARTMPARTPASEVQHSKDRSGGQHTCIADLLRVGLAKHPALSGACRPCAHEEQLAPEFCGSSAKRLWETRKTSIVDTLSGACLSSKLFAEVGDPGYSQLGCKATSWAGAPAKLHMALCATV